MSPIEDALLPEFRAIFLEVLVPMAVQIRIPGIRRHWQAVLESKEGAAALQTCFVRMSRERRSIGESIRDGISRKNREVTQLKNALYNRIGHDNNLTSGFIGRSLTDGNEQCPYWGGFAYEAPPREIHFNERA